MPASSEPKIDDLTVSAYKVPTASPEADGTMWWDSTTVVVVELRSGEIHAIGYSYADAAAAYLIDAALRPVILGKSALASAEIWIAMNYQVRGAGRPGVASMAISAVDSAVWDLKGRLLNQPLVNLLGRARDGIPAYGSGGFTTYSIAELQKQLSDWAGEGMRAVKMKIGTDASQDVARVRAAREAIGSKAELYVDANGAYTRKQALRQAHEFAESGVTWFEEPVSSDDLEGLRLMRDAGPPGMAIAAGEYGFDPIYFRRMLEAGAVDVQQADATRCGGVTGFLQVNGLCDGFAIPLSAHTAPTLHTHLCCAATRAINVEYFFDHYRIEQLFFDGAIGPVNGTLRPHDSRSGLGVEFKRADAEKYLVFRSR